MPTAAEAEAYFRKHAPWLMAKLMADFPFNVDDAAAIAGNGGHESFGFTKLQEIKPTVKGSRGGYGWFQWTGPRRRAYEDYCARNGHDKASPKANYKWLFLELRGSENAAVGATTRARGLKAKVRAFEKSFERAGVKHYAKREHWARIALDAWSQAQKNGGVKVDTEIEKTESKSILASKRFWGIVLIILAQFSPTVRMILEALMVAQAGSAGDVTEASGAINQIVTGGGTLLTLIGSMTGNKKLRLPKITF